MTSISKHFSSMAAMAVQKLCISNLAGETLATFSADEVEDKCVHQLKTSLAKQIGATRFHQRWLAEDCSELDDDAVVPCGDVQLVILDFVEAQEDEIDLLVTACEENHPDELVDHLCKPLNPDGLYERQGFMHALHLAAENGHSRIVQLLLEAGTDTDICDDVHLEDDDAYFSNIVEGRRALQLAAREGHSEVVKLLLEAGADKDSADEDGNTALHWEAWNGNAEVMKLLLEAGADKDRTDNGGSTALHWAAWQGRSEVAKLLIEAGADKDAADCEGLTPLHRASASDCDLEVVKLLVEAGAKQDVADRHGRLPMDLAFERGHQELYFYLVHRSSRG